MFKIIIASLFVIFAAAPAMANDSPQGFAKTYKTEWVIANSNGKVSGVVNSTSPTCNHREDCSCGGENFCGSFKNGQTAKFWTNGCDQAPLVIKCKVR